MKLLTPQQTHNQKQGEAVKEILRTQEMREVAAKARKELANAQADFKLALAKNQELWAKEEENHFRRVKEMVDEIEMLEAKKARALVPIKQREDEAEALLKDAWLILEKAKEREADADDLNETLQDKLDELGQREQDIIAKERKQYSEQIGINDRAADVQERSRQLTREIMDFSQVRTKAEQDIHERKTALVLWDRTLVAKEATLKRTEESLNALALQLKDERATLERAFKRKK